MGTGLVMREFRINVTGTTGSGKTTMGRNLAQRLGVPHVELDALHWDPNWTEAPNEVFRERTSKALAGDEWVVDGNYSAVRDIVWTKANIVVWLDYSLPVIMARLWRRSIRRLRSQEELWNGNRETFRNLFLSRDSLFLWALQTYQKRRRDYPVLFNMPQHAHLTVVHLKSPREAVEWLSRVSHESLPTEAHESSTHSVSSPLRTT